MCYNFIIDLIISIARNRFIKQIKMDNCPKIKSKIEFNINTDYETVIGCVSKSIQKTLKLKPVNSEFINSKRNKTNNNNNSSSKKKL